MNAAIRSVVRTSLQLGMNIYLVKDGYYGLIQGDEFITNANWYDVSSILSKVCGFENCIFQMFISIFSVKYFQLLSGGSQNIEFQQFI